ncbi:hypothetical protein KQI68_07300 [Peptoniphilus sp. MSJ-1]|uniref:Uncharacterized protein n=1 Tax=Peptoniphilus ovalis TaxID=2841503 RepID=A0ABS6FKB7_9FIRM|nr:hypothetical protein [Peptoniphilus ovalis]MBU5669645.1 hypothetical protein [Peptoniphilus ovalis]
MALVVYKDKKYTVKKNRYGFILCNNHGDYDNHGHFKRFNTCMLLIGLMESNVVPDSEYLRQSVLRISIDEKYLNKVKTKMDKGTKKYININKGVKRK